VPLDAPLFGIVAALRPEKNHLMFLRAAALIRNVIPHARFWVIGDGVEREKLAVAIRAVDMDGQLQMLGSRDDIPQLLAAMDVFMLSSLNEANPVSILEAMATGLPVVATDVGSVSQTVEEGVTGYLVEIGDAERMARRGVQLAADLPRARCLGAAGRRQIMDYWSLDRMICGYQQLIESAYRRKASPGWAPVVSRDDPHPRSSTARLLQLDEAGRGENR
jgi:glycosyltransferase involved in cell wall biosynthesis